MPKVITSPVKQFPGTVTLTEPLFLPQAEVIEEALDFKVDGDTIRITTLDKKYLPAVFACVEKWDLVNFQVDPAAQTIQMSPRRASHEVVDWIWSEIIKIYIGESEVPNE